MLPTCLVGSIRTRMADRPGAAGKAGAAGARALLWLIGPTALEAAQDDATLLAIRDRNAPASISSRRRASP